MSDTTEDILETMRTQLHEMELDHVQLAGRIMQHRTNMALVEHGGRRRGGRPRKSAEVSIIPQRVAGGVHEPERDDEGELPSIDDVRGILRTDPPEAA